MSYTIPDVVSFKTQFPRDFPYNYVGIVGSADDTSLDGVRDMDILNAQTLAVVLVNSGLCESQVIYALAVNLLTAHYLSTFLQAASQGLSSTASWAISSRSVGDLKETYALPPQIKNNPVLSALAQTQYGKQYLSIFANRIVGNITTLQNYLKP